MGALPEISLRTIKLSMYYKRAYYHSIMPLDIREYDGIFEKCIIYNVYSYIMYVKSRAEIMRRASCHRSNKCSIKLLQCSLTLVVAIIQCLDMLLLWKCCTTLILMIIC